MISVSVSGCTAMSFTRLPPPRSVTIVQDPRDAQIAALKEALLPFVKLANQFSEHAHDDNWTIFARNGATVYLADLRRARSTYEGKKP